MKFKFGIFPFFDTFLFTGFVICQYCKIHLRSSCSDIAEHSKVCKHVQRPDETYKFVCFICQYHTKRSDNMKNHIRRHIGEKPYECPHCMYCTSQSSHLKVHMRSHTGERPYKCSICLFGSTNSAGIKYHYLTTGHGGLENFIKRGDKKIGLESKNEVELCEIKPFGLNQYFENQI